jgi:hypothetical protein
MISIMNKKRIIIALIISPIAAALIFGILLYTATIVFSDYFSEEFINWVPLFSFYALIHTYKIMLFALPLFMILRLGNYSSFVHYVAGVLFFSILFFYSDDAQGRFDALRCFLPPVICSIIYYFIEVHDNPAYQKKTK